MTSSWFPCHEVIMIWHGSMWTNNYLYYQTVSVQPTHEHRTNKTGDQKTNNTRLTIIDFFSSSTLALFFSPSDKKFSIYEIYRNAKIFIQLYTYRSIHVQIKIYPPSLFYSLIFSWSLTALGYYPTRYRSWFENMTIRFNIDNLSILIVVSLKMSSRVFLKSWRFWGNKWVVLDRVFL